MIITTNKPKEEVIDALDLWGIKKAVIVSCGNCAAKCGTGGTKGVEDIMEKLKDTDVEILGSIVMDEPCDRRIVTVDIKRLKDELAEADGVIVAACGVGGQTVREVTNKPIVITTNTQFIATTQRLGVFYDYCQGCGDCVLNETGGVCPYTRCPKKLLNGPCGGVVGGKCEVGDYKYDCAWIKIYSALEKTQRLDLFDKLRDPRDWAKANNRGVNTRE